MKNKMTRNAFPLAALLFFTLSPVLATADSPVVQGLGGAGRAGVPGEALFLNPAAVSLLTQSGGFLYFQKPGIPDWNAGGRSYSVGLFDGQNAAAKGSFGFHRASRARIDRQGNQGYEDRSEWRFAMGTSLGKNISAGLTTKYINRRTGEASEKFFNGDLGAIFPVYAGLMAGVTLENAIQKPGERPPSIGAGVTYALGYGFQGYADGYRFMKGNEKGERGWALGLEAALAGDFKLRAGKFQDGFRRMKGWSGGLTWAGPRTSFDYSMRTTGQGPKERDHIFGMTVMM